MTIDIFSEVQNKLDEIKNVYIADVGYVNDVYIIETGVRKYVLKLYKLCNNKQIKLSIDVQKYLFNEKLAPEIILEHVGETNYIVQEYICNENDEKNWTIFGRTLGMIHFCLRKFNDYYIDKFCFGDFYETLQEFETEKDRRGVKELIDLKRRIRPLVHLPELECNQLIHGDYTWNNILKCNSIYKTIDLDETKKYYKIYDVAKVVFDLIFNKENNWEQNISNFLNGYQDILPISIAEKKEFLNVYAYTLEMDFSGIRSKTNKDMDYLKKRIEKHRRVLSFLEKNNGLEAFLSW